MKLFPIKKSDEEKALHHLREAKKHAETAERLFEDDSKGEDVANNTKRWARASISSAEKYLEGK